jgi:isopropylmalate/homocitrate/citramalate synthase
VGFESTGKWFVSAWNYLPEITSGFQFPQKIRIHDVTLRDGEQQAGIEFRREEKVRIAAKLAEAGVHRIEAGMPAVSPQDEAAIKEIVKLNLGPEIFAFSRCMVPDVKRAVDCGVKGIVVEVPSSPHIIQYAYKWPLEKAIDLSIEATQYAKEQGLYTVFFPIDSSRSDMSWYLDLIEKVATEGHMDALAVVDTFGVCSPHAITFWIAKIKERIKKPLETHFHDDFGMGVANTIMALVAGAEVAHTTVTGIGERAGNCPFEDLVLSLLTMYGQDLGIRYQELYSLSRLIRELSGLQIPSNRPIVGDMLFNIESGIIASWYRQCGKDRPTELFPFHWELVGQRSAEIVLGKNSGLDSIAAWLERIGEQASEEEIGKILSEVKMKSLEKKGLLVEEEFRQIVRRVKEGQ